MCVCFLINHQQSRVWWTQTDDNPTTTKAKPPRCRGRVEWACLLPAGCLLALSSWGLSCGEVAVPPTACRLLERCRNTSQGTMKILWDGCDTCCLECLIECDQVCCQSKQSFILQSHKRIKASSSLLSTSKIRVFFMST